MDHDNGIYSFKNNGGRYEMCFLRHGVLNWNIPEERVYILPPKVIRKYKNGKPIYWKLKRSLYGLDLAPRCWQRTLTNFLKSIGLKQSVIEPSLFYGEKCWIIVYVDDLVLVIGEQANVNKVMEQIRARFELR
jgi:hypothetical protein